MYYTYISMQHCQNISDMLLITTSLNYKLSILYIKVINIYHPINTQVSTIITF